MAQSEELQVLYEARKNLLLQIQEATKSAEIQSYSFSDSDGSQSATRRDIKALMEALKALDAQIASLEQKLRGGGIRTFGTNRYGPGL
jgi:hypothetical protein